MSKIKVVAVDYDFTPNTMPVLRALNYCGSYPIPDKSRKQIYSSIFFNSEKSIQEAQQKRNRKKELLITRAGWNPEK